MKPSRHPRYARHRFPAEVISHAIWLYFRFPLSLRLVEEMLLERGILVSYETVRRWALKFGPAYARRLRRKTPSRRNIWHLDGFRRKRFISMLPLPCPKSHGWRVACSRAGILIDP
jgi:transposase-like protein